MALARWTPFTLSDFSDGGFDEIVRRAFGEFGSQRWAPALDARMEGSELKVRLELPGIDPDADVDIEVSNGILRVSGERKADETTQEGGWYRREMRYGSFERQVALPEGADAQNVRASYDAGVLEITVPVPGKATTKVKVEVGTQKQLKQ
jgi:HSP20 family protein